MLCHLFDFLFLELPFKGLCLQPQALAGTGETLVPAV